MSSGLWVCVSQIFCFYVYFHVASNATSARFQSTTHLVSSSIATEPTAAPQKSRNNNIVIGLSAFGGVLALVIVVLVIAKFVHMQSRRAQVIPDFRHQQTKMKVQEESNINEAFELSEMPGKM